MLLHPCTQPPLPWLNSTPSHSVYACTNALAPCCCLPPALPSCSAQLLQTETAAPVPLSLGCRVYVCNDSLVPIGVVTLTDILHKLVEA